MSNFHWYLYSGGQNTFLARRAILSKICRMYFFFFVALIHEAHFTIDQYLLTGAVL